MTPKVGGFGSSTFIRLNKTRAILALHQTFKTEGGDQMDLLCANCEHDLTPPIVDSTRHGSTR